MKLHWTKIGTDGRFQRKTVSPGSKEDLRLQRKRRNLQAFYERKRQANAKDFTFPSVKTCYTCGETKRFHEFAKGSDSKFGRQNQCSACRSAIRKRTKTAKTESQKKVNREYMRREADAAKPSFIKWLIRQSLANQLGQWPSSMSIPSDMVSAKQAQIRTLRLIRKELNENPK